MNYKTIMICAVLGASMQNVWGMHRRLYLAPGSDDSDEDFGYERMVKTPNRNQNVSNNNNQQNLERRAARGMDANQNPAPNGDNNPIIKHTEVDIAALVTTINNLNQSIEKMNDNLEAKMTAMEIRMTAIENQWKK